jgi:ribosomal protein S18 acetylase RimI-like enzyme
MNESIYVRTAVPEDADGIARVHVETWQASYAGVLPDSYLVTMRRRDHARQWHEVLSHAGQRDVALVLEARSETARPAVLGFASAGPARDAKLLYDAEVYTLYVGSDWQGQGLGRLLLGTLFRTLFDRSMEDAMLWVLADNPSRFFYQHMGGQVIARRDEHLAGSAFPALAYGWPDLEAWLRQVRM